MPITFIDFLYMFWIYFYMEIAICGNRCIDICYSNTLDQYNLIRCFTHNYYIKDIFSREHEQMSGNKDVNEVVCKSIYVPH